MWPSRWLTPTIGVPCAQASALAAEQPTRSEPTSPGPWVTAMPSRSRSPMPASASALRMTGTIISRWRREASSGTTPPYLAWTSSWEATTFESTLRPPSSTAAAVSSHDVSIPSTIMVSSRSIQPSSRHESTQPSPHGFALRLELPHLRLLGVPHLELPRQLGHGHEADAAGFPARDVLAQEPRGQGMPVRDDDDLPAALRPPGDLVPLHAVAGL